MGVPGLFASIVKNYNKIDRKIIKQKIDNDLPNHLYLDFNGGIYQVLRDEIKTEEALIIHAVDYLETLCKIIPNLELIYIAIDGVCPRAKMEQQRQRRFHSICRKNRSSKINEQFGTELDKSSVNNSIDTNMITPGTRFMDYLSKYIDWYLKNSINTDTNWQNIEVIFSNEKVPGEGEHKIMNYIRKYGIKTETYCMFGLDSDLIMFLTTEASLAFKTTAAELNIAKGE